MKKNGRDCGCRNRVSSILLVLIPVLFGLFGGCSAVKSSLTAGMSESLARAINNQNDPETVRQGAPAYLLMVDGFIEDEPDNPAVLISGARLYAGYAAAFVKDSERAVRLSRKARDYGRRALCLSAQSTCEIWEKPYGEFESVIREVGEDDIDALYTAAMAWASWIKANSEDWSAIADKARVEAMMLRVLDLDERYEMGEVHLYLGILATLLPKALGGEPEKGREYFEKAIEYSQGNNLMAKVLLARDYARMVFNRKLHDRLCREVLNANPEVEGMTLSNMMAQDEARALLEDSKGYFE